ncbi:MAG: hypothetical protein CMD15_07210 [Flavobacteriales bacterium]|nr:hypothetical protein [Flavobacteriales bacterium]
MKRLSLLFFFLTSLVLYSQENFLIVDINENPLENVDVFFVDQSLLVKTNDKGIVSLDKTLPENSYIHLYKKGYASQIIKYKREENIKFILKKLHVSLDEVGVVESFNELGNSRLTNIEKQSLEDVFLSSNTMVESISRLSGINIISSGLGIQKVVVRGLSGMRVVSYVNGMQINNQQWANDHGIGFTDLGLAEVELIKGSSALKYGSEAIGGLLYFKDSPFNTGAPKGFISTKFNNSSFLSNTQFGIKLNKKNIFLNLFGQYSISSDYRLPNGDYLFDSRFMQNSVKLSLGHRKNNFQNIFRYQLHTEATGIPGHVHGDPSTIDIMQVTSSSINIFEDYNPTRPTQYIYNQLFTYESSYMLNKFKYSLHAGHFINNLQEWDAWTKPAFDLTLTNTQITPNIRYSDEYLNVNLGVQMNLTKNTNATLKRLVPDANTLNLGTYFIIDYESNNIGYNVGVRSDYKKLESNDNIKDIDYTNDFYNTSFSSGAYYKLLDHTIRFSYSGAYRAPHVSELFSDGLHHGTNRYEIGNPDLDIEFADQFDLKYQWSNEHLGFVVNPFLQYITDFISIIPNGERREGFDVYNYIQYKKVEIRGVEMNLHYHPHQLHNLHLEQTYSFLQTDNKDSKYGLALTPANSVMSRLLFDLNDYKYLRKYKLDYISCDHTFNFWQESVAEFEQKTPSYYVINAQIGFRFNNYFKGLVGVYNILNESYTPHTSRLRNVTANGVPNPGRFFSVNLKYKF